MIEKTEAIVLQSKKYGDTSSIVHLYTRRFGKMTVMAKGSRGRKGRFGSALDPMSYILAVIYKKENREIQLIAQADHIQFLHSLRSRERKLIAGLTVVEFLLATTHEEDANAAFFDMARSVLIGLNSASGKEENYLLWFLFRLTSSLGFEMHLQSCSLCRVPVMEETRTAVTSYLFDPKTGGIGCSLCVSRREEYALSLEHIRTLIRIDTSDLRDVEKCVSTITLVVKTLWIFSSFLRYHVPGLRTINSLEMLESILSTPTHK